MSGAWYSKVVEKLNKLLADNDGDAWLKDSLNAPKIPDFYEKKLNVHDRDHLLAQFVSDSTEHVLKNVTPNFVIMLTMVEEMGRMKAAFAKTNDKIQSLTVAVTELIKSNNDLRNQIGEASEAGKQKDELLASKNDNPFGTLQQGCQLSKQLKRKGDRDGSEIVGHSTWAQHAQHTQNQPKPFKEPEKKMIKKLRVDENNKLTIEEFETIKRKPRANNRPRTPEQIQKDQEKETKNKEIANREIILCGLPSPNLDKYEDEDETKEMEDVMAVLEELETKWIPEGVDLKDQDFAFAQRQWGHHNEKFLPMTVRFRYSETAEKVKIAAEKAGILGKRKPSEVGKHRIPKENEEEELVVNARAKARPKTWIRLSVTEKERKERRAVIESRLTTDYLESKKVDQWMKRRRINWSRDEDKEKNSGRKGAEANGTGNANTK